MEILSTWFIHLQGFHFLRPLWFLALIPALLSGLLFYRFQSTNNGSWSKVISPQLLPFLLDNPTQQQRKNFIALWMFAWLIGVLGLSGPTFEQTALPVHKQEHALVIVFDLSPSMLAQDLKPDRLTRARLKLIDLLQSRTEGNTALVAYGGDAYVVSPLTNDSATIAAMVPALDPNLMPSKGSNVEAAIEKAVELVFNAEQQRGDILLITDEISSRGGEALRIILRSMGDFRLFILGVGTEQGAPIPSSEGGFVKDRNNGIVIPKLNSAALRKFARQHNGVYTGLSTNDADINFLLSAVNSQQNNDTEQLERTFDTWHDIGYLSALLLLPLLLLASRKGVLVSLLFIPALLPQPSQAFEWDDLWLNKDQQAAKALQKNDSARAEQLFNDPNWKGAAAYRNNNFKLAEELFRGDTAANHYNRGNALAKAGLLEEAIEAYDLALKQQPDMENAQYNKSLAEELLAQQQQQQAENQGDSSDASQSPQENKQQEENGNSQESQQEQQATQQNRGAQEQQNQSDSQPEESQDTDEKKASEQAEKKSSLDENEHDKKDENKGSKDEQADENQQLEQLRNPEDALSDEELQAVEQWLRRIPDDPGGLLRRKFLVEAQKRQREKRWGTQAPPGNTDERW